LGECPAAFAAPIFNTRIFHDHLVPGNENRPAFGVAALAATACLAAIWRLCRFVPRTTPFSPRSTVPKSARATSLCRRGTGPSLRADGPGDQEGQRAAFLIDLKIVAKAAEDKKVENSEDFKRLALRAAAC
jgi:peptidyl-prolyl cis-trans isomerase C